MLSFACPSRRQIHEAHFFVSCERTMWTLWRSVVFAVGSDSGCLCVTGDNPIVGFPPLGPPQSYIPHLLFHLFNALKHTSLCLSILIPSPPLLLPASHLSISSFPSSHVSTQSSPPSAAYKLIRSLPSTAPVQPHHLPPMQLLNCFITPPIQVSSVTKLYFTLKTKLNHT